MSTKMSNDLNITRPTSRVIRAPGGSSAGMGNVLGENQIGIFFLINNYLN